MVILWVPSDKPQTVFGESSDTVDKEFWRPQRVLPYVHSFLLTAMLHFRNIHFGGEVDGSTL
jgi:hypothetical protein